MINKLFLSLLALVLISASIEGMEKKKISELVICHYDQRLFYDSPLSLVDLAMDMVLQNSSAEPDASPLEMNNFKELSLFFHGDHPRLYRDHSVLLGDYFDRICERSSWLSEVSKNKDFQICLAHTFANLIIKSLESIDAQGNLTSKEKEDLKVDLGVSLLKNESYQKVCANHLVLRSSQQDSICRYLFKSDGSYRCKLLNEGNGVRSKMMQADLAKTTKLFSQTNLTHIILADNLNKWLSEILPLEKCTKSDKVLGILSVLKGSHPELLHQLLNERLFLRNKIVDLIWDNCRGSQSLPIILENLYKWGYPLAELDQNKGTIVHICVEYYFCNSENLLEIVLKSAEKQFSKEKKLILLNYKFPVEGYSCSKRSALGGVFRKLHDLFNLYPTYEDGRKYLCRLAKLLLDHGAYDRKSMIDLKKLIKETNDAKIKQKYKKFLSKLEDNFRADGKKIS